MAVFTPISFDDAHAFFKKCVRDDTLKSIRPIAEGTDNTNYLAQGEARKYILTVFEDRIKPHHLPGIFQFMAALDAQGFAVPHPYSDQRGNHIHLLCGKPAALTSFLPGTSAQRPTAAQSQEMARLLADMHDAADDMSFDLAENDMSRVSWQELYQKHFSTIREHRCADAINALLAEINTQWPTTRDVRAGNIHADAFPDNVFFDHGQISGVIDFYFACHNFYLYDVMLTLNAWCFDDQGQVHSDAAHGFLKAYHLKLPISPTEMKYIRLFGQAAALRIALTRFRDLYKTGEGGHFTPRDPMAYMNIVQFHQVHDLAEVLK